MSYQIDNDKIVEDLGKIWDVPMTTSLKTNILNALVIFKDWIDKTYVCYIEEFNSHIRTIFYDIIREIYYKNYEYFQIRQTFLEVCTKNLKYEDIYIDDNKTYE